MLNTLIKVSSALVVLYAVREEAHYQVPFHDLILKYFVNVDNRRNFEFRRTSTKVNSF